MRMRMRLWGQRVQVDKQRLLRFCSPTPLGNLGPGSEVIQDPRGQQIFHGIPQRLTRERRRRLAGEPQTGNHHPSRWSVRLP